MTDPVVNHWPHGEMLKEVRTRMGLSQERAAARIGRTRLSWANWEAGKQMPDADSLKRIVEVFEVPPDQIGYEAPGGWEIVPVEWVRQQFEQQSKALQDIASTQAQILDELRRR